MKPLIDCDVLRYEIGSCGEFKDENGELVMRDFDFVANLFDEKVREICELTWATEPPTLFLTVDKTTHNILYRKKQESFLPNFRESIAKRKPYKGTRSGNKPLHYANLTAYILNTYNCVTARGLEADDLLAYTQSTANELNPEVETIICTRDKDLRMVDGWHFGWSCGAQSAFGPELVSGIGELKATYRDERLHKVSGTGSSFFCYQLLVGDTVDNIPGLPGCGPVKALAILEGIETYQGMLEAVRDAYKAKYGDTWDIELTEQAQLLWMVRKIDEDTGLPVMWEIPEWLVG